VLAGEVIVVQQDLELEEATMVIHQALEVGKMPLSPVALEDPLRFENKNTELGIPLLFGKEDSLVFDSDQDSLSFVLVITLF
jgi:hypothetical protein